MTKLKEKDAKKVIKALTEIKKDVEKNHEKRYWSEIKVPFTLSEGLSNYTKDELVHIRKFLDLKNASSLRKAELIALLEEKILQFLKRTCLQFDADRFELLTEIARNNGRLSAPDLKNHQVQFLRKTGLVYTGTVEDSKIVSMPEDLIDPVLALEKDAGVKAIIRRNTEWVKLTKGLLYYYGTLSTYQLVTMLKKYTGKTRETFELQDYFTVIHHVENHEFYSNEEGFSYHQVLDSKRVMQEQQKREHVPFYSFTKDQLLEAGEPGFVDRNETYTKLVKLLVQQHNVEQEKADRVVKETVNAIKNGKGPSEVLQYFSRHIVFESQEAVTPIVNHLMDLMNNTREWILKGNTPAELFEEERKHLRPLPKTKYDPEQNKPITKKKIGRNEPCPCGSGKKYKKCCGR